MCYPLESVASTPTLTEINGCRERKKRDPNLRTMDWNVSTMDRSFAEGFYNLTPSWFYSITLAKTIKAVLWIIQGFYYPILAIVGVPGKSLYSYLFTLPCCCCCYFH